MNIKKDIILANENVIKWSKFFKPKIVPPKISIHYRRMFNGGPVIACLLRNRHNLFKKQFKIHLMPDFFFLKDEKKEGIIKHEVCHLIDIVDNTFKIAMQDSHGERFQEYLNKINGILTINIFDDYKQILPAFYEYKNIKSTRHFACICEKTLNIEN